MRPAVALCAMVCALPLCAADELLTIPPWTTPLKVEGQSVQVTLSGTARVVRTPEEALRVKLNADLNDLNEHLTDLLRERIHNNDRCGQRIDLRHAELRSAAPAALLTIDAHIESYLCAKALGKQITTKLLGGDAQIEVRLTPRIEEGHTLRMTGEVRSIRAEGTLGDLLRSEPFGSLLRQKMESAVERVLHRVLDRWRASLPEKARDLAIINEVRFAEPARGGIAMSVDGEVKVPIDIARMMLEKLKSDPHPSEP